MSLEGIRVLYVDDSAPMRSIVRAVLRGLGVGEVYDAGSGAEGLSLLKRFAPDLVIVDFEMPPPDGPEFIRALRTRGDELRFAPVILLTAHTDIRRLQLARDAGVSEIMAKPITIRHVVDKLNAAIMHPRPFVLADTYCGPDRRRRRAAQTYDGPLRRRTDPQGFLEL